MNSRQRKPFRVLFVCTGNICRSPMAEFLFRRRLGTRGVCEVGSAGLAAFPGLPASVQVLDILRERGLDATGHRSRCLDRESVDGASLIVVMTAAHVDQIRATFPHAAHKVYLLKSFGRSGAEGDIEDPIGGSEQTYRKVCDEIEDALSGLAGFAEALAASEAA